MSVLFSTNPTFGELRDVLNRDDNFRNRGRTFSGDKWGNAWLPARGWMSDDDYEALTSAHDNVGIDYVIRSYDTVIAYRAGGKWVIPSATYTRTTARHHHLVSSAIAGLGKVD